MDRARLEKALDEISLQEVTRPDGLTDGYLDPPRETKLAILEKLVAEAQAEEAVNIFAGLPHLPRHYTRDQYINRIETWLFDRARTRQSRCNDS